MAFIEASGVKHEFERRDEEGNVCGIVPALCGVTLQMEEGMFAAILGHNGSGKSTFARHINVLLLPSDGTLRVDGMDTADAAHLWDIRQTAGMIFQNPDNQLVAGVVEEDVAFGAENTGVPTEEIGIRVTNALQTVGMTEYRMHSPNLLSGGQKQRVAIAGVLAMESRCMIFDESTAMLDPSGRAEVLETALRLNKEKGVTVIWITHNMEEVVSADRIYVMDAGRVTMEGTPAAIFARAGELKDRGLAVPMITSLSQSLKSAGLALPEAVLTQDDLLTALTELSGVKGREADPDRRRASDRALCADAGWRPACSEPDAAAYIPAHAGDTATANAGDTATAHTGDAAAGRTGSGRALMTLEHVSYTYSPGTSYEVLALSDVNLTIYEGEFLALIGHTGSGKSTLLQLLGGLLKPESGKVSFDGEDIYARGYARKKLRAQVGLVFQYPEYQLFEMTVLADAAFGPKNLGFSDEEAIEKAKEGLRMAGLPEKYWEMSPFELSGGEKRRAAIAGVLAMQPALLILDEPTAGLDPKGRRDLFAQLKQLHETHGMTIVLVSHNMDDVAELAGRVVLLDHGRIMRTGTPREIFSHRDELEAAGLTVPQATQLMYGLRERGFQADLRVITPKEAQQEILRLASC